MSYSIKIWLTSTIIAPLLWLLCASITSSANTIASFKVMDAELIIVMMLMGTLFSLPSFGVFYITTIIITERLSNVIYAKLMLSILGVILIYLPFLFIDDGSILLNIDQLSRPMFITYSVILIASVWIYKLRQGNFVKPSTIVEKS